MGSGFLSLSNCRNSLGSIPVARLFVAELCLVLFDSRLSSLMLFGSGRLKKLGFELAILRLTCG